MMRDWCQFCGGIYYTARPNSAETLENLVPVSLNAVTTECRLMLILGPFPSVFSGPPIAASSTPGPPCTIGINRMGRNVSQRSPDCCGLSSRPYDTCLVRGLCNSSGCIIASSLSRLHSRNNRRSRITGHDRRRMHQRIVADKGGLYSATGWRILCRSP